MKISILLPYKENYSPDYAGAVSLFIHSNILNSKFFKWLANEKKDWQEFSKDWIYTKYQKKAAIEGRTSIILRLQKCLS